MQEQSRKESLYALLRERLFFIALVAILLILAFILVAPLWSPILGAFAAVVILKPLYNRTLRAKWVKGKEKWAAGFTVFLVFLLIALPIVLFGGRAISQAIDFFSGSGAGSADASIGPLAAGIEELLPQVGLEGVEIDQERVSQGLQKVAPAIVSWLGNLAASLGGSLPQLLMNAVIVLVLMMVLLPVYMRPGRNEIVELVPFPPEITQLFLDKVDMMIIGMFKGTIIIAIVQGAAMGLVFWIAGVPFVMMLTLASMFLALIPMIGISLLAWPIGIALLLTGQVWQGIFVIAAFLLVVANLDALLRPRLVPKGAYLNPALVILSVFGGMQMMGMIGILYGPVIMILLVTAIEVYTKYLLRSDLQTVLDPKQEHVDLEELGLAPQGGESEESGGILDDIRELAKHFRLRRQEPESDDETEPQEPEADGATEPQEPMSDRSEVS